MWSYWIAAVFVGLVLFAVFLLRFNHREIGRFAHLLRQAGWVTFVYLEQHNFRHEWIAAVVDLRRKDLKIQIEPLPDLPVEERNRLFDLIRATPRRELKEWNLADLRKLQFRSDLAVHLDFRGKNPPSSRRGTGGTA